MGNTVIWKPASTAALSAHYIMRVLQEAGLPDGVINLVYGSGATIGDAALASPELAGIHFTGSTPVFQGMWKTVGDNIANYRNYPRIVGETGGKDFIVAHPSADVDAVATAILRGSFEYQGQKCSAASRVYAPKSLWPELSERLAAQVAGAEDGRRRRLLRTSWAPSSTAARSRRRRRRSTRRARRARPASSPAAATTTARATSSSRPCSRPTIPATGRCSEELFGPVVTTYVYDDKRWARRSSSSTPAPPTALTGAVFADDRYAIEQAHAALRYAAGNFYVNDKPTGAVVGQQPFGGARASGTNDKAGSLWNLMRWVARGR